MKSAAALSKRSKTMCLVQVRSMGPTMPNCAGRVTDVPLFGHADIHSRRSAGAVGRGGGLFSVT